ncbi:baseplate hub protein [Variovorax sp. WDL1]
MLDMPSGPVVLDESLELHIAVKKDCLSMRSTADIDVVNLTTGLRVQLPTHRLQRSWRSSPVANVGEVDDAIARIEALPAGLLAKDAGNLALIVFLRAYVSGAYWAELQKSKPAADCVPMLRIIQAAGGKPVLRRPKRSSGRSFPLSNASFS